jgi:uncharacterized protein with ATP-grasp and redox domains
MMRIPPYRVDPTRLPLPLLTSEPGSFAYNTFKVRVPLIVDNIIALNAFGGEVNDALIALRGEITNGSIRPLVEDSADRPLWDALVEPWVGRTWLDVPWYWAEAYFYRRVLEATRYFQPGQSYLCDPYQSQKEAELNPNAALYTLAHALQQDADSANPNGVQRFEAFLQRSLWGNRTDLSYNVAAALSVTGQHRDEQANLLVDDTLTVWECLSNQPCRRVAIITDNAGTELLMDLALADFLLIHTPVEQVVLHLKTQPFFVSDAMPKDVLASVQALLLAGGLMQALAERLQTHLDVGRLILRSHGFYATSLFYFQMPNDLYDELQCYDFVVLKGDANYRRLLGDAHWLPTTSFVDATAYFPAPLVSLRTLKAELIVGLPDGLAQQLDQLDPQWRVNGRRGVIQANLLVKAA